MTSRASASSLPTTAVAARASATTGAAPGPVMGPSGSTATLLSIATALVGLSSYACSLTMAHLLDPDGYTAFAACAALVGTAGVASAALIPLPLAHAVRAGSSVADATTFATGVSVLVGTTVGAALALVTTGFASPSVALAAGLSGLSLFIIAPVWGYLQGQARFRHYAVLSVVEVLVRLGTSVGAVVLGLGMSGAVSAFALGALAVLLVGARAPSRSLSPSALPRVLTDRNRWRETGGVAATQAVLSVLAVVDLVVVAVAFAGTESEVAAAGYQAVAALAKAPIYVAAGTALVSFPALRASTDGADRDRHLHSAMTTFGRLVVPAAVVVATVPPELVGIVLPNQYAGSLTLLPWLVAGGVGIGATTVVATLLLARDHKRALALGLAGAALALGCGIGIGSILDEAEPIAGLAHGGAVGALIGAAVIGAAGAACRPRGRYALGAPAVRGVVYLAIVLGILAATHRSPFVWLVCLVIVGLVVVTVPVLAARARTLADPDGDLVPAPGRLRVLHLAFEDPSMPGSGGGAVRTAEIDRRLAAAGHCVIVITTRFPGAVDRTERRGGGAVRWAHVGFRQGATRLTRLLGYVVGVPFLVRSIEADVVVEDFFAPISSMGVPWFSPHPTAGIVQWINAREKAREYHVPVHWVERLAVRRHRHLVAMSRGVADQLAHLSPRAAVTVIGNGLDPAAFASPRTEEGRNLVFLGRLERGQKGLDLLVDAWAAAASDVDGQLVIAGTGPDEQALRDRVAHLGITERVHFVGWVAGRDKYDLLASARAVAVPSRFETFGIVAIEALAAGAAVVAYDIDCLREVVPTEPVAAGALVPLTGDHGTDVRAYATALRDVLTGDTVRAAAAQYGPQLAAEHDWDALAGAQETFLHNVVAEEARSGPCGSATR